MLRKEFVRLLATNSNLPVKKTELFVRTFINVVTSQLAQGNKVLISNLGAFSPSAISNKNIDPQQNPQPTANKKKPSFNTSYTLKKSIGKDYTEPKTQAAKTEPELAPISGEQIIPIQRPAKTEPIEKISSHTTSAPASLAAKTTPQNQPSSSFLKSGSQINYGTKIKPTPDSPSTTIPTPSPKPESKPVAPSPTPSTKKSFFGFLFGKKSASRTSSPTLDASEKLTPTKSEKPIEPVKTAPIAGPKKEPTTLTPVPTNPAAKTAPNPNNLAAQNPNQANVFKNARKEITATLSETAKPKNDISYVDLRSHKIPKEILAKIPEYIARLYQAIPVEEKNGKLIVAMVDPEDYQAIEFIKKKTGAEIKPALATQEDIGHVLEQYSEFESEIAQEIKKATPEKETKTKEDQEEDIAKAEAPTSRAVQSILKRAVLSEASDIHIEPYEKEVIVTFRIDGVLQEVVSL